MSGMSHCATFGEDGRTETDHKVMITELDDDDSLLPIQK